MVSKGLRRADLARLAGVSRAAVTRWFKSPGGMSNVETRTLIQLAAGLDIPPEFLLQKRAEISPLAPLFLWDHLFPSMEAFALSLARRRLPAIARLVEVMGFRRSASVIGSQAIALFPKYKKHLKPARRHELEILWPLYRSNP